MHETGEATERFLRGVALGELSIEEALAQGLFSLKHTLDPDSIQMWKCL